MSSDNPTQSLFRLDGQTAVVTGAGAGIGRGVARTLAAAGASVVAVDRDAASADQTRALIQEAGGQALSMAADVTDEDATRKVLDAAVERFGRLDILVNNAGIYPFALLQDLTREMLDRTLDVNLVGPVLYMREAARRMQAGGRIVNISSIESIRTTNRGLGHYGASKAGISAFTRAAAVELADIGLRVNAVLPGFIVTEGTMAVSAGASEGEAAKWVALTPCKRPGSPDDIAGAVLFLASGAATFITGQTLVVDGGLTIQSIG